MASEFPPGDRPANLLVEIKTRDDQEALLTVGAPIVDGEPLLEVTFISQDARRIDGTIRYAARNLRAVAKSAATSAGTPPPSRWRSGISPSA